MRGAFEGNEVVECKIPYRSRSYASSSSGQNHSINPSSYSHERYWTFPIENGESCLPVPFLLTCEIYNNDLHLALCKDDGPSTAIIALCKFSSWQYAFPFPKLASFCRWRITRIKSDLSCYSAPNLPMPVSPVPQDSTTLDSVQYM